jgi:hypothetical protein
MFNMVMPSVIIQNVVMPICFMPSVMVPFLLLHSKATFGLDKCHLQNFIKTDQQRLPWLLSIYHIG